MGLSRYKAKRNFKQTPEPDGKIASKGKQLKFVVQKHEASRLHYDLRLEMEGVLKSWAVPKGPSMIAGEKRLAVMVEDHPLDYADFYGEIPQGNYGAGIVDIFDKGTYKAYNVSHDKDHEAILLQQLNKGDLKIELNGTHIKGAFALIKIKSDEEKANNWLLIKKNDSFTLQDFNIETIKPIFPSGLIKRKTLKRNPNITEPERLDIYHEWNKLKHPMLATSLKNIKKSVTWLYEVKLNGLRTITMVNWGDVEMLSFDGTLVNSQFTSLFNQLKKIKEQLIFDGEVVNENNLGNSFQNLSDNKAKIKYYVFDLIYLNGHSTALMPLRNRKELLEEILKNYNLKDIISAPYTYDINGDLLKKFSSKGFHEIIAKNIKSKYTPGKLSSAWVELKFSDDKLTKGEKHTDSLTMNDETNVYDQILTLRRKKVKLTNLNKVFWPEEGITKGDLISYYNSISEYILPYLKNRPQSLNRFPNGIKGPNFYQKDMEVSQLPKWAKTVKMFSKANDKEIDYLICNDKSTLLFMVNLGCIEINPWHSVFSREDFPDYMMLDLDPGDILFTEVVNAAIVVKELCEELKINSFCKTSGATGLHIYIPLGAKYDYNQVKTFAEILATITQSRIPEVTTIERTVAKRGNKIYVDFLQNRKGQTIAAPYSVRPRPGATVSTPLLWSEVNHQLHPTQFHIKNILQRLEKKGDLWKGIFSKPVDLIKVLNKLEKLR